MTGHVFHPGHAELHGITVVIETRGPLTYVGRYDSADDRGVHLLDAGIHDAASGTPREEYLQRSVRYGILSQHRHIIVAPDQIVRITRLGDLD
jgi:hypothetical protein